MPVKMGKKTYKSFGTAVGALEKQGYSESAAKRIVGSVEAKQHPKRKRKS